MRRPGTSASASDAAPAPAQLAAGFLASCLRFPGRPALEVEGQTYSYAALRAEVQRYVATLEEHAPSAPAFTAILAERSLVTYAGVLAALYRGHAYVPLNPAFPVERLRDMLLRSGARALVADAAAVPRLVELLAGVADARTVLLPASADVAALQAALPQHRLLGAGDLRPAGDAGPARPGGPVAYLLFTSGSTGRPKGVLVAPHNVLHLLAVVEARYAPGPEDRFSQMFDLSFDLSVFDLFLAWQVGACVCCPSRGDRLTPARYLVNSRISIWFSVPSLAVLMKRMGALAPGLYPDLRWSLFCGEALPAEVAASFARAAPNAPLENLYGPTELTVACTAYRFDGDASRCPQGLVPIGSPFPGMEALVVDAALREVAPGEAGELLMSGPQLTLGYLDDPEKTAQAFLRPPGRSEVFYRTGDRVERPRRATEPLVFRGRVDHQVKVHGHRVELGEIEAVLRQAAGVEVAVALGWPVSAAGAEGIVAFLGGPPRESAALAAEVRRRLPSYMVPREYRFLAAFPLNANGKVDRGRLREMLEGAGS